MAAVVAIAVVAFVIAKPGGDDADKTASTPSNTSEGATETTGNQTKKKKKTAKPRPTVTRIAIKGTEVQGGVKTITVRKGDPVRIVVTSDAPNKLHLHGFEIEKDAAPGKPARFRFKAKIEGEFELESHTFEDAGVEAGLAKLRVEPS